MRRPGKARNADVAVERLSTDDDYCCGKEGCCLTRGGWGGGGGDNGVPRLRGLGVRQSNLGNLQPRQV